MKQAVIFCVLIEVLASHSLCQETSVTRTLPKATGARYSRSLNNIFHKSFNSENLVPLSQQERVRLYLTRTYGMGSTLGAAAAGGFEQLINTPNEWRQGSQGYRNRFASSYATHVIQRTIEYGASALLSEDNRYRRSLETGCWRRSKHAITGAFSSTDEAGRQHLSYSLVGSAAATAFIRRTWQPASTGGVGDAVASFGFGIGAHVGQNVFREFWPDLKHHFFNKR